MPETLLTQFLKRPPPDPMADIGQGGEGMYTPPNPVPGEIATIGQHLLPEYLRNNDVHKIEPNEVGKTPRSQPMNPLPWLGMDIAGNFATAGAKAAAPAGKAVFGGILAKFADKKALEEAKRMSQNIPGVGFPAPREVWPVLDKERNVFTDTGWFRDIDGHWKFEIPDYNMELPTMPFEANTSVSDRLPNLIGHPELYKNYPKFENAIAVIGHRDQPQGLMWPRERIGNSKRVAPHTAEIYGPDYTNRMEIAAHELNHGTQGLEGHAPGMYQFNNKLAQYRGKYNTLQNDPRFRDATYNEVYDLWGKSAGEVSSKNAEKRLKLTPENRLLTHPLDTADEFPHRQWFDHAWYNRQTPEIQAYIKALRG